MSQLMKLFPRRNHGLRLLTVGNPKTEKGVGKGFWTFILHLAPARLSGFEVCPKRTDGCTLACLNVAGRGGIAHGGILTHADLMNGTRTNQIQVRRIARTRAFFETRDAFMVALESDIIRACAMAKREGLTPVFRLNGTSDIRWETVPCGNARNVMERFPDLQFYDYTKISNRRNLPRNYHLTFSLAENNDAAARGALNAGMNVAAVFRNSATVDRYIASGFDGRPVYCGDDTDLRFLDPPGHIIALYAKGAAKRDASGFVRD